MKTYPEILFPKGLEKIKDLKTGHITGSNVISINDIFHDVVYEELKSFNSDAIKPNNLLSSPNFNKSLSKSFFLPFIKEHIGDNLIDGYCVSDGKEFLDEKKICKPDFLIKYDEKGYIAVEIDEPYTGADGIPLHFINGGNDYKNRSYLKNKWIIVRFAEEQVIRWPEKCVILLFLLTSWIVDLEERSIDDFIQKRLTEVPRWTKEEAHKLAYHRFRETYLPDHLKQHIHIDNRELEVELSKIKPQDENFNSWDLNDDTEDDLPF